MRKGRSQRKARGSLPPLSTRPRASTADGPQVVIGLTPSRSDEPTTVEVLAEATRTDGPALARSEPPVAKLEVVVEPTLELVREAERPEAGDHEEARREEARDAETRATADVELVESSPAPRLESPPPRTAALPTPDEMSIPPVGDLSVEPIAERFFSEGELAEVDDSDGDWDHVANKAIRKSLPEVVQRRARLSKYVRWAVGGAAVVCLAALARTTLTPSSASRTSVDSLAARVVEAAPAAKAAAAIVVEPAALPTAAAAAAPAEAPAAAAAPAEAPAAEASAAEAQVEAPKVDVPTADGAKAKTEGEGAGGAAVVAAGDKTALQEKNEARRALERGKITDAIAAGERSVALDPTDGEAWLLLGAAYQEKGKNAEARRAYASCIKEGKRGPLGECRAMIR